MWQASHTFASMQSYLGIQDVLRKARPCSQQPGAWAGAIVNILAGLSVCVLTSVEIWNKMKGILSKWWIQMSEGDPKLLHKELLSNKDVPFHGALSEEFPPHDQNVAWWTRL